MKDTIFEMLGEVYVDSGTITIHDPCVPCDEFDAGKDPVDCDAGTVTFGGFGGDGIFPVIGEFLEGEGRLVGIFIDLSRGFDNE